MWLYESFQEFSREALGGAAARRVAIIPGRTTRRDLAGEKGPPVIVAPYGALRKRYPMLEGRHRQTLPQIPGRNRGRLLAGASEGGENSNQELVAWLVPWRVGADRTLVVTVKPGTVLAIEVAEWPGPQDERCRGEAGRPRDRTLRRAANVLGAVPGSFATEPSIGVQRTIGSRAFGMTRAWRRETRKASSWEGTQGSFGASWTTLERARGRCSAPNTGC